MQDYSSYDAIGLAELVSSRQVSPRELVAAAIANVEVLNPRLNAVVHTMFDKALKQAEGTQNAGPFSGVPFMLKDLLSWYEGEPIASGSRFFKGWHPPHDTEIVKR